MHNMFYSSTSILLVFTRIYVNIAISVRTFAYSYKANAAVTCSAKGQYNTLTLRIRNDVVKLQLFVTALLIDITAVEPLIESIPTAVSPEP